MFYPLNPSDHTARDAFTAKKCLQKSNYIVTSVAERLQLDSRVGAEHELVWSLLESLEPMGTSTFTVVPDDIMHVQVALGTDLLAKVENILSPHQPLQDQSSGRGEVRTQLNSQDLSPPSSTVQSTHPLSEPHTPTASEYQALESQRMTIQIIATSLSQFSLNLGFDTVSRDTTDISRRQITRGQISQAGSAM
ncbi:hypothetical protein F4774DRAFT_150118 [Daldinia eschscholtzii]|nr:hypothetical protein F4774DRAFT_150118 [Daldinia eschscholtzii]